jgi:hypothetical protein
MAAVRPPRLHAPARDRLLGPPVAPLGRVLGRFAPGAVWSLAALAAAAGAGAALLAGARVGGGLLILLAAVLAAAAPAADAARGTDRHPPGRGGGAVTDAVADLYADTLILAGMAAWSHAHERLPAPLAAGFLALAGTLVLAYTAARVQASAGAPAAARLFAWTGRDLRLLVAAAGTLTGLVYAALVALAALSLLPVLWAIARLYRMPPS